MCSEFCEIYNKINIGPNDLKLVLLDLSCDALHLKNMNTHATVCVFIYRFICARVFKCILMYIKPTKYETKFVRLLFRFTFQNCNHYSREVFIFYFLNVFLTYSLKNEKCLVNYRKITKLQKSICHLFSFCRV